MPEEAQQAPEETQDTPAPEAASAEETPAPESTTEDSKPATDYEQRYNDLRPQFDRNNQLLAAARGEHGPEAQAQALLELGVELQTEEQPQEEVDDDWFDPEEEIKTIKQELAEERQSREAAEFQKVEEDWIDKTLSSIEGEHNVKLSEDEERVVIENATANRLPNGEPNLQGAFDSIMGIKSAARDEYLASKKAPRAPAGTAGEKTIDFSDPEAKKKWMAEDLAARMSAEES